MQLSARTCWILENGFFDRENIFLFGPACYSFSPLTDFNLAVQDACNLAWRLSFVTAKRCSTSLLYQYELERRPLLFKRWQLHQTGDVFFHLLHPSILNFLITLTPVFTKLINHYSQKTRINPFVGDLFPNDILLLSTSLFLPGMQILIYGSNLGPKDRTHIERILLPFAGKLISRIHYEDIDIWNVDKLKISGLVGVFLVRPDGIVAYRSEKLDLNDILRFIRSKFKVLERCALASGFEKDTFPKGVLETAISFNGDREWDDFIVLLGLFLIILILVFPPAMSSSSNFLQVVSLFVTLGPAVKYCFE